MEKLLHERLREFEENTENVICSTAILAGVLGVDVDCTIQCLECRTHIHSTLADEIERYYIPRPRFEDGEPVGWRETDIAWDNADSYAFNAITVGGRPLAYGGRYICAKAKINDEGFVKRTKLKALDAEGVPIKVGDTVWCVNGPSSLAHKVTDISENGYITTDVWKFQPPENFTHKEPDSFETLLDDMKKVIAADDVTYGDVKAWADRLSAIIERGA